MTPKTIKGIQPVNFHADIDIHTDFVSSLPKRVKSKREALNEAMYMWTIGSDDPVILERLKELAQNRELVRKELAKKKEVE